MEGSKLLQEDNVRTCVIKMYKNKSLLWTKSRNARSSFLSMRTLEMMLRTTLMEVETRIERNVQRVAASSIRKHWLSIRRFAKRSLSKSERSSTLRR